MPTKGNRILSLRVEPDLLAQIEAAVASANERRVDEPYNMADWIKAVIRRELAHLERGRKRGQGRRAEAADKGRAEGGN